MFAQEKGRNTASASETDSTKFVAFGISSDSLAGYLRECTQGVQAIKEANEFIMSRSMRRQVEELCQAANTLIAHCQEMPTSISQLREFPIMLERVPSILQKYAQLKLANQEMDSEGLSEAEQIIASMTENFARTPNELLTGSRIGLAALSSALARLLAETDPGPVGKTGSKSLFGGKNG